MKIYIQELAVLTLHYTQCDVWNNQHFSPTVLNTQKAEISNVYHYKSGNILIQTKIT